MKHDDLERVRLSLAKPLLRPAELVLPDPARLMAPRPHRVEADDVQRGGGVRRLGRLPLPLELAEGPREARGKRVRDVVVSGDREHRGPEVAQELRCAGELVVASPMTQIAAGDDKLGLETLNQDRCPAFDRLVVSGAVVKVREM